MNYIKFTFTLQFVIKYWSYIVPIYCVNFSARHLPIET